MWKNGRLLLLVLVAVLVAACSKGSTGAEGSSGEPPVAESEQARTISVGGDSVNFHGTADLSGGAKEKEVEVETDDYYFNPTIIGTTEGEQIVVGLHNESENVHNFTFGDTSEDVQPGEEKEVFLTVPSGGGAFFCKYHESQGMRGIIQIGAPVVPAAGGSLAPAPAGSGGNGGGGGGPGGYGY